MPDSMDKYEVHSRVDIKDNAIVSDSYPVKVGTLKFPLLYILVVPV